MEVARTLRKEKQTRRLEKNNDGDSVNNDTMHGDEVLVDSSATVNGKR
jgi:hypothetical protein